MEHTKFNHIIKKSITSLKQEENVTVCLLTELEKSALGVLSENKIILSAVNKFQDNFSKKALYVKERKEALLEQLQQILSATEKDNHVIQLKLHEKGKLKEKLEELKRKKEELTNNKEQTAGQQINVDNLKNCLRVCKVLTKTHFDFGNSVCGYTLDEDLNYKCFHLKHQEDQHKVIEYLWDNMPIKSSTTSK
ncbi:uncharacterized protein LOC108733344 [Agrilus planipennis]|uniref:Uncharacterized protein LOC108733344 n=1 Tax=Agrilus planipennis TaxID=224129 RepID=A0A1W4WHK8_AGRPL|nr:uncharacterized protein LOC108733344 [Agrilus planipennis]